MRARVFCSLLWRDLILLKRNSANRLIDATIWSANNIIISSFILPALGITPEYGIFIWVGSIVSMALFEAMYSAQDLVSEITGDNHLLYLLTIPLPSWLVFVERALSIAINCMVLSIFVVPLGKLILLQRLDLSQMSMSRFLPAFVLLNIFCGFFAVWIASWAKGSTRFAEVWRRVFNPLWMFGGYQFSWSTLYATFPRIALITLLNPITYAFESMRAALLGQDNFLPFWVSSAMLMLFIIMFAIWGLTWLKRRLDYV